MSRADELANWLVGNKDKKGTPEWEAKAEQYRKEADAEERKVSPSVQAGRDDEKLRTLATEYFKEMQKFKQGDKRAYENMQAISREIVRAGGSAPEPPEVSEAPAEPGVMGTIKSEAQKQLSDAGPGMIGAGAGLGAGILESRGMGPASILEKGAAGARRGMGMPTTPAAGPVGGPAGPVSAAPPPAIVMPGAPPAPPSAPGAPSIMRQPSPMAPPAGGPGAFNYGKAFGLTDIEAGRALDMSKQPGGASDLIAQRRQAMQRVEQMFPGQFAENQRYSGIMTPDQSVGRGPRASYVAEPGAPLRQLPPSPPIPTTPKPSGALEQVTQMFRKMADTGIQASRGLGGIARALPVLSYPAAGYSMGQDIGAIRSEMEEKEPDYADVALRGLGALGTGLSLHPATAPVGIPMALGAPLLAAGRRKLAESPPAAEPTYEELVRASRPSFRMSAPKSRGLR